MGSNVTTGEDCTDNGMGQPLIKYAEYRKAIPSKGLVWSLAMATIEFLLQAFSLLAINQHLLGALDASCYPELGVALISFFVLNLETAGEIYEERPRSRSYPSFLRVLYWVSLALMFMSVVVGAGLALLTLMRLEEISIDGIRLAGLVFLGVPTLVHIAYRLSMLIISMWLENVCLPTGGAGEGRTLAPADGPGVANPEVYDD